MLCCMCVVTIKLIESKTWKNKGYEIGKRRFGEKRWIIDKFQSADHIESSLGLLYSTLVLIVLVHYSHTVYRQQQKYDSIKVSRSYISIFLKSCTVRFSLCFLNKEPLTCRHTSVRNIINFKRIKFFFLFFRFGFPRRFKHNNRLLCRLPIIIIQKGHNTAVLYLPTQL